MGSVRFKLSLTDVNDYYFEQDEEVSLRPSSGNEIKKISLKGKNASGIEKALESSLKPFGPMNDAGLVYGWLCGIVGSSVEDYVDRTDADESALKKIYVPGGKAQNLISASFERVKGEWYVREVELDGSAMGTEQKEDLAEASNAELVRNELAKYRLDESAIKMFLRGVSLEDFVDMTYSDLLQHSLRKNLVKNGDSFRTKSGKARIKYSADDIEKREKYFLSGKPLKDATGAVLIQSSLVEWLIKVIENIAEGKKKRIQTDAIKRQKRAQLNADIALRKAETIKRINKETKALMATFSKLSSARQTFNPSVMNVRAGAKPLNIPSLSEVDIKNALGANALLIRSPKQTEPQAAAGTRTAEVSFSGQPKSVTERFDFYRFTPLIVSACQTIKGKFDLMNGCIMMAAYFQILVSNTPIDEDYEYQAEEISTYKKKTDRMKEGRITQIKTSIKTKHHAADKVSVRGDWVLTFRGKTFKAFDSEPEKGSVQVSPDSYFSEEYFDKGVDTGSMMKMAEAIMDATGKDFDEKRLEELEKERLDPTQCVTNINPRWQVLETGGYNRNPATLSPRKGTKYGLEHGTKNGFTYQAPHGFIRLTNALWSELSETGKWADIVQAFVSGKQYKVKSLISLDVKDTSSPLVRKLMKRDRSIGKAGFARGEIGGNK